MSDNNDDGYSPETLRLHNVDCLLAVFRREDGSWGLESRHVTHEYLAYMIAMLQHTFMRLMDQVQAEDPDADEVLQ